MRTHADVISGEIKLLARVYSIGFVKKKEVLVHGCKKARANKFVLITRAILYRIGGLNVMFGW